MDMNEKLKVENYVEENKMKVFEKFTELCNNGEPPTKLQDDKVKMTEQNEAEIWANCFKQINVGRYYAERLDIRKRLQLIFWKNRQHFSTSRFDIGSVSPNFYLHSVQPLQHIPQTRVCQPRFGGRKGQSVCGGVPAKRAEPPIRLCPQR